MGCAWGDMTKVGAPQPQTTAWGFMAQEFHHHVPIVSPEPPLPRWDGDLQCNGSILMDSLYSDPQNLSIALRFI